MKAATTQRAAKARESRQQLMDRLWREEEEKKIAADAQTLPGWPSFCPFPGTERMRPDLRSDSDLQKAKPKLKKHDHRDSYWVIGSGTYLWCYRCGALAQLPKLGKIKWTVPTGPDGKNPV